MNYMPKLKTSKNFPMDNVYKRYTKHVLQKKNKKNCSDYKKAVDLGKRSGGGKILITFYDLYQDIWAKFYLLQVFPMDLIHQWFQMVRDEKEI